jgi:hypothetical protein
VISRESLLGRTLRRDPHLALCVDDTDPNSFVTLEGHVEIFDDPPGARRWLREMALHYEPEAGDAKEVEAYLDAQPMDSSLLCRMEIARICFQPTVE